MVIRIVLADDHVLVRQGLKTLLEREGFQVVSEASDSRAAAQLSPGWMAPGREVPSKDDSLAAATLPRGGPVAGGEHLS